jgi:ribosomal protein S18 acetylase RimI-like enzyme
MEDELAIRVYQNDDEQAVVELWEKVFPGDPPWNKPIDVIRNKLAIQPAWFFVCSHRKHVVGTVLAGYDGVRGWVQKVAVDPEHRRQGIASLLMSTAERALREAGCPKLNLQTRTENSSAIEFYKEAGYEIEDRVSMSKHL